MNVPIAKTHEEAVERIREMASAEIAYVPVPCKGEFTYYASKAGEVFRIRDLRHGSTYGLADIHKDGCVSIMLPCKGGRENRISVANMVYSAFVAREFAPMRKFKFRNGNPRDCAVDNIIALGDYSDYAAISKRMTAWCEFYIERRDAFIKETEYKFLVPHEVAEDIVEEAFVALCNRDYPITDNAYLYQVMRNRILWAHHMYLKTRWCELKEWNYALTIRDEGMSELLPYATRNLASEKMRQALQLWSLGYTLEEIAAVAGTNPNAVNSRINGAKKALRKALRNDIQIYHTL